MKEKKEVKVRLSTAICMIIIFILIVVLGVTYYFGFIVERKENPGDRKVTNNTENVTSENKVDKENTFPNNIKTYTENQVMDLLNSKKYIGNDGNYDISLDRIYVSSIKKDGSKFIINAKYYIPVEITKEEYNRMVQSKKITIEGTEYVFSKEKYNYGGIGENEEYTSRYIVLKTDKGYAFQSALDDATVISTVKDEISFMTDGNIEIIDSHSQKKYKLEDKEAEELINSNFEEKGISLDKGYKGNGLRLYISNI